MEKEKVRDILNEQNIPIIDVDSIEDVPEELNNLFGHWDITGSMLMKKTISHNKVILAVLVPDFVAPYSNLGELVPVIISCPKDPYIWEGFRFNLGMMEDYEEKGYKIIIFNSDFEGTTTVESFKKYHLEKIGEIQNG